MQQHGSKCFLQADPQPQTLGGRVKGPNSTFPELYIAYQIEGNDVCSNMLTDILLTDLPPPDTGFYSC